MSHFAEIDDKNLVLRVIVGNNDEPDEGYSWIINNLGGKWIKTSYNNKIRNKFAQPGDFYDPDKDIFYSSEI